MTDWFETLTGFRETTYTETRDKLRVQDGKLCSLVNGKVYRVGDLELVSLSDLRERVSGSRGSSGHLRVSIATGDVGQMHRFKENNGALFQVASQFNLLEMVSPAVTPEDGVTRYQYDQTQGPACAIAAGAATIYRNYFAPVGGVHGQTNTRQLDALADLGNRLAEALERPVGALWRMQNGYALCTKSGLAEITAYLDALTESEVDTLRGQLRIGVHWDVEVTDPRATVPAMVSQAFCSALPVAYSDIPAAQWRALASLVLEAAYEATILAAVLNAQRGMSNVVLLTLLGGGVFGNHPDWIMAALRRALAIVQDFDLDVRLVSYGEPSAEIRRLVGEFG